MSGHLRSAVIVPVDGLPAAVDLWRERTCGFKPSAGVPAHVTLLFPFVPTVEIDDSLVDDLARILLGFMPFAFALKELRRFPGALWLAPEPAEPFAAITAELVARYPDYLPYEGAFGTSVPHLTVAEGHEPVLESARAAIEPGLPLLAHADQAVLLRELVHGRWAVHANLPLCRTSLE